MLVFRRLVAAPAPTSRSSTTRRHARTARAGADGIDTSPVGFAVFDRVLMTVHPAECPVREYFASA